jgi:hypothetical protein
VVDVVVHDAELHVYDQAGEPLVVIPRTSSKKSHGAGGLGSATESVKGTAYVDRTDSSPSGGDGVGDTSLCSARLHNP